jgi:hypothetical protein
VQLKGGELRFEAGDAVVLEAQAGAECSPAWANAAGTAAMSSGLS